MSFIEARYLDGSSVYVKSETIGGVMVHFANLHQRFASDIAVVCPTTGRDLTDPPSQMPPPLIQVVVKPEEVKKSTKEDLLLTFHLHAQHEDTATCARAYEMLQKEYRWGQSVKTLLDMLDKVAGGDIDIEAKIIRAFIHVGLDLHFVLERACGDGNESRVKMLLSQGVPIECRDNMDDLDDDIFCYLYAVLLVLLCVIAEARKTGGIRIRVLPCAMFSYETYLLKEYLNLLSYRGKLGRY